MSAPMEVSRSREDLMTPHNLLSKEPVSDRPLVVHFSPCAVPRRISSSATPHPDRTGRRKIGHPQLGLVPRHVGMIQASRLPSGLTAG